jgi:hypothetical protein
MPSIHEAGHIRHTYNVFMSVCIVLQRLRKIRIVSMRTDSFLILAKILSSLACGPQAEPLPRPVYFYPSHSSASVRVPQQTPRVQEPQPRLLPPPPTSAPEPAVAGKERELPPPLRVQARRRSKKPAPRREPPPAQEGSWTGQESKMLQHATRRTMVVLRPVARALSSGARALVLAFLDYLRRVDEALGDMFFPPPPGGRRRPRPQAPPPPPRQVIGIPRALGEARFRELLPAGPAPSAARAEGVPFPTRIPGAAEVERGATSTGASDANAAQGGHTDAAAGAITDTRAAALERPPLPPSAPRNRAPGGARNCNGANATAASGPIAAPHAGRPSNDDAAQVVRVPLPEKQAASGSKTKKLVPGSKKIVSSQVSNLNQAIGFCCSYLLMLYWQAY